MFHFIATAKHILINILINTNNISVQLLIQGNAINICLISRYKSKRPLLNNLKCFRLCQSVDSLYIPYIA